MRREDPVPLDLELIGEAADDVLQPTAAHRWPKWTLLLLLPVALVIGLVAARGHSGSPAARPTTLPSSAHHASSPVLSPTPPPTQPVVHMVGHRLLGVTSKWELFARTMDSVVRIQLASGRITATPTFGPGTNGPSSFLAADNFALSHEVDGDASVVPDGQPARGASGVLAQAGIVAPGPRSSQIWVQSGGSESPFVKLVGSTGRPTGIGVRIPDNTWALSPDGAGYLTFSGVGGIYDLRPGSMRRITTGMLIAVGPTAWLAVECDATYHCYRVVVDQATGRRRMLGPVDAADLGAVGLISPDGSLATVYRQASPAQDAMNVDLVDLRTGVEHKLPVQISTNTFSDTGHWSPDGRWLMVADASGRIRAVDATTLQVHDLDINLPAVLQLAIRP